MLFGISTIHVVQHLIASRLKRQMNEVINLRVDSNLVNQRIMEIPWITRQKPDDLNLTVLGNFLEQFHKWGNTSGLFVLCPIVRNLIATQVSTFSHEHFA